MAQTRCLTASMLEIGMRYETEFVFTHEQVARFCELCGDKNALHCDVDAARLRFPEVNDIIVPGGLLQISIMGLFGTVFPGDGSLGLTFAPERMRKPIFPGETIRVILELIRLRGDMGEFAVSIFDADGGRIGSAKSRVIVPGEGYRAWWSDNYADAKAS